MNQFKKFNINNDLINKLNNRNITIPTKIQDEVIPKVLDQLDIIAQSKTGTGKTISYLVPLIDLLLKSRQQVLIIAPTKELARQIYNEAVYFTEGTYLKIRLLVSGDKIENQVNSLKSDQDIIIAVPGRILKLAKLGAVKLTNIKKLILDETDFLLDLGFIKELEEIFSYCKNINQTMIFSATLSQKTKRMIDIIHNQKYSIRVDPKNTLPELIENYFFPITDEERINYLLKLVKSINPYLSIIFARTKDVSNYVYKVLKENKIKASLLNGDMTSVQRKRAVKEFSEARTQYLVATDLASRGIDIPSITHIINYNLPVSELDYLHRAGRSGRMDQKGIVYSLCNELDEGYLKKYASILNFNLKPAKINNNKIEVDNKYSGVKPRFNLRELKKIDTLKKSQTKKKGDKIAKKPRRNRYRKQMGR